ncbi:MULTISPECIES: helix-turn-helix domain-containing protein [unclassified Butyrivibrio]|uniref:helix-turn-helix domain-containing protein n=1 Tax=unclassified Butyrivibrio TaxID=2639466 RepID=UPI0003B3EABD|nr:MULTISPECIES: helix-turn-helix transcriptional regulator [unclassified Butyrivibrio]SEK65506.1 Helix-turn-helix domain-containing protein [Butyrivibrio sp. ob235]
MGRRTALLLPKTQKKLQTVGEQIKLARLRRHLTAEDVAERARVGRSTVVQIEKGSPSVSMGMYLAVLNVLGLSDDILLIAKDDVLGRTIQDLDIKVPRRVRKHE